MVLNWFNPFSLNVGGNQQTTATWHDMSPFVVEHMSYCEWSLT